MSEEGREDSEEIDRTIPCWALIGMGRYEDCD